MKLSYFFRHPSPKFHSIEEQFFAMQKDLPKDVEYKNVFAKYQSKGIFKRIFIAIQSAFNQGDVNHITGDINFIAMFLLKKRTILTIHDIGSVLKGSKIKQIIKRFFWYYIPFSKVKYITVISEFSKREIIKKLNVEKNKIKVIPNCYSPMLKFNPKKTISNIPIILQIGTKSNKNLDRVILAVKNIKCAIYIVGELSNTHKSLLQQNNISYKNFKNITYSEIIELYNSADITIFVSTYEGFGVPIIEAQAVGCPVITSDLSPMKEVAGGGALLVNPYDINKIRQGVIDVIENKVLRKKLIEKGKENANKYSAKNIAIKYYNLYKTINN